MDRLSSMIGTAYRAHRHLRRAKRDHAANLDAETSDGLLEGCLNARRAFLLGRLAIGMNWDVQLLVLFCFAARDLDMLSKLLAAYAPDFRFRLRFDERRLTPANVVADWTLADGIHVFRVPDVRVDMTGLRTTTRWLALIPLFTNIAKTGREVPKTALNLGDGGQRPGVAFCASGADFTLIPDSDFFATFGYRAARAHFEGNAVPWDQRESAVFWRGSPTGIAVPGEVLPRIALCLKAQAEAPHLFDCGLTGLSELGPARQAELAGLGIEKAFVPWQSLAGYKYHIDIDGNSNAWSGLFLKLLSGGLVFKVASPTQARQWYYDRLRPWETFIPVDADLGNLVELVRFIADRDDVARPIAEAGRALARSLDFDSQLQFAEDAIFARPSVAREDGAAL